MTTKSELHDELDVWQEKYRELEAEMTEVCAQLAASKQSASETKHAPDLEALAAEYAERMSLTLSLGVGGFHTPILELILGAMKQAVEQNHVACKAALEVAIKCGDAQRKRIAGLETLPSTPTPGLEEFARNLWDALAVTDEKLPVIVAHVSEYLQQGDKSDPDLEALVEKWADRWPVWVYGSDGKPVKDVISQEILALVKEATVTQQVAIDRTIKYAGDLIDTHAERTKEHYVEIDLLEGKEASALAGWNATSEIVTFWQAENASLTEELATSKRRAKDLWQVLDNIDYECNAGHPKALERIGSMAGQALSEPADGDQTDQQPADDVSDNVATQIHRDFCEYIQSKLPSVTTRAEVVAGHFEESYPLALVFNLTEEDAPRYRKFLKDFRAEHPDEHISVRHHYDDETREHFPEMLPDQQANEGEGRLQRDMDDHGISSGELVGGDG